MYTQQQKIADLIKGKLAEIELEQDVEILFAVESGSRAWGFPSLDSDYDVRFVYRRKPADYMRLIPLPDTIGRSLKGAMYDVHGWDVAKALKLALGTNATLLEWMRSPIRYRWTPQADKLLLCAERVAERKGLRYNYYNQTNLAVQELGTAAEVPLKKYFYAARTALTLRHLRLYPAVPPMDLESLIEGVNPGKDVKVALLELRDKKASGRELGLGARIPALDALVAEELEYLKENKPEKTRLTSDETLLELAQKTYLHLVGIEG